MWFIRATDEATPLMKCGQCDDDDDDDDDDLFFGMVDRQKAFSLISRLDHCQRSSPFQIFDTPRAGFEPAQDLSSGFGE